jgi:hypothetical protein
MCLIRLLRIHADEKSRGSHSSAPRTSTSSYNVAAKVSTECAIRPYSPAYCTDVREVRIDVLFIRNKHLAHPKEPQPVYGDS